MEIIRVLLADDHSLFREGMSNILHRQADFEVVGKAKDGLEATQRIKQELPDVAIVMLTVHEKDEKLFKAIACGAQGYVLKSIRSQDLMNLLRGITRGETSITPDLTDLLRHPSHCQIRDSGL